MQCRRLDLNCMHCRHLQADLEARAVAHAVQDFWTSMKPYVSSEAYQNYIDKDLGAGSMAAYYGSNVAALVAVKTKYDSKSFFSYPFSVATSTSTANAN